MHTMRQIWTKQCKSRIPLLYANAGAGAARLLQKNFRAHYIGVNNAVISPRKRSRERSLYRSTSPSPHRSTHRSLSCTFAVLAARGRARYEIGFMSSGPSFFTLITLVLNCRECNNTKRDKVPSTEVLKRLVLRNENLRSG